MLTDFQFIRVPQRSDDQCIRSNYALPRVAPNCERPEFTAADGFFLSERVIGDCEFRARADYIIRDHNQAKAERRKAAMVDAVCGVNKQIGSEVLPLRFTTSITT